MAEILRKAFVLPTLLAFITAGAILGVVLFLVEGIFDVSLSAWLEAVIAGVSFIAFTLLYRQISKAKE
jgi:hypothetical protein